MTSGRVKAFGIFLVAIAGAGLCRAGGQPGGPALDSLKRVIYRMYLQAEDYDKAIAGYESLQDSTAAGKATYVALVARGEAARFQLDSLRLELAKSYTKNDGAEQAEAAYAELVKSSYAATRNYASHQLDSLIHSRGKEFYEKYPFSPITEAVKPALPYLGIVLLVGIIVYCINKGKSGRSLRTKCNLEDEIPLFQKALQIEVEKIAEYNRRNAHSSVVLGVSGALPIIAASLSEDFVEFSALIIPEKYSFLIKKIRLLGLNQAYILDLFIEKGQTKVRIYYRLKRGEDVLDEADMDCAADAYFDIRLDIAYRVLIEIQKVMK